MMLSINDDNDFEVFKQKNSIIVDNEGIVNTKLSMKKQGI